MRRGGEWEDVECEERGGEDKREKETVSIPDARVEVVWLKSRHAMGPSWPDNTSNNRP